jgi:nucleotide-binding universal stress UspA family protein
MKSILLHINEDEGQEARLQAALAVARVNGGRLFCVQVTPISAYMATDPFGGMHEVKMLYDHLAKQAVAARTQMETRLSHEDVKWEWSVDVGDIARAIVGRSRLVDLIVLSLPKHDQKSRAHPPSLVAEVVLHARAPVLAVPVSPHAFRLDRMPFIAWNGSPEAAIALRMAIPLLESVHSANIVTLDLENDSYNLENDSYSMDDAQAYLASHGITATHFDVPSWSHSVGEALCSAAIAHNASYVIMGLYGHSRLREAVVGGASRYMLTHSLVPLLLAH